MSTLDDIRQTFFQECDELLEALNDGLTALEEALDSGAGEDPEIVNAVFRAVHSIKGGAAAFGLEQLVRFAHRFETALDDLRAGRMKLGSDVLQICQRAADHLVKLVSAARDGTPSGLDASDQILAKLAALSPSSEPLVPEVTSAPDSGGFSAVPLALDLGAADDEPGFTPMVLDLGGMDEIICDPAIGFRIRFSASERLFTNGSDPVHLFRELAELGTYQVIAHTVRVPDIGKLRPSHCHLTWTIDLQTQARFEEVGEIFDFVDGLCNLEIATLHVGEVPLTDVTLAETWPPEAPTGQPDSSGGAAVQGAVGDHLPQPTPAKAPPPANAPDPKPAEAAKPKAPTGPKATVRVDLDQVDRLINVVGELVINQAVLNQHVKASGITVTPELNASLDEFTALAREIQEGVMSIRAQSVKLLFQRMARIAREAGDLAGKTVRLETEGEDTEVDKTVIERLVDPLTHILRNSVDHGLEHTANRIEAGKPETGKITLRAAHRSGRVLIEVSDDGAGINRAKVLEIAISKGLVAADANLSDGEIDNLLFLPGFSTAATVTNLSGRGVGMDVVRSEVQKLGGRITITSQPGQGTTLSISLPLTLAVLDGMVVDVAGQTMVIPITTIIETIRPNASEIHEISESVRVVAVRDSFVEIVDLGSTFNFREPETGDQNRVYVLIEGADQKVRAFAVDQIHDQRQVVIKGLTGNYGHIPGIAAATILGNGKVALIIDPEEACQVQRRQTPINLPKHPPHSRNCQERSA